MQSVLIGISGPSCSGKTSVVRFVNKYLPSSVIIHEDDFYRPENELPMCQTRHGEMVNWDCAEAIDMLSLTNALSHVAEHGSLPHGLQSKEDQNEVVGLQISADTIEYATSILSGIKRHVVLVDGFMLYNDSRVSAALDARILLRGSKQVLERRRAERSGYVTLEGFWKDPEGYFEDVVWPGYVNAHKQFFKMEDVEGSLRQDLDLEIQVYGGAVDMNLEQSIRYAIDMVNKACKI